MRIGAQHQVNSAAASCRAAQCVRSAPCVTRLVWAVLFTERLRQRPQIQKTACVGLLCEELWKHFWKGYIETDYKPNRLTETWNKDQPGPKITRDSHWSKQERKCTINTRYKKKLLTSKKNVSIIINQCPTSSSFVVWFQGTTVAQERKMYSQMLSIRKPREKNRSSSFCSPLRVVQKTTPVRNKPFYRLLGHLRTLALLDASWVSWETAVLLLCFSCLAISMDPAYYSQRRSLRQAALPAAYALCRALFTKSRIMHRDVHGPWFCPYIFSAAVRLYM